MTRAERALRVIERFGGIDGDHHKTWVLDQVARALHGCKLQDIDNEKTETPAYKEWVKQMCDGDDGPETYSYDEGIAP